MQNMILISVEWFNVLLLQVGTKNYKYSYQKFKQTVSRDNLWLWLCSFEAEPFA